MTSPSTMTPSMKITPVYGVVPFAMAYTTLPTIHELTRQMLRHMANNQISKITKGRCAGATTALVIYTLYHLHYAHRVAIVTQSYEDIKSFRSLLHSVAKPELLDAIQLSQSHLLITRLTSRLPSELHGQKFHMIGVDTLTITPLNLFTGHSTHIVSIEENPATLSKTIKLS